MHSKHCSNTHRVAKIQQTTTRSGYWVYVDNIATVCSADCIRSNRTTTQIRVLYLSFSVSPSPSLTIIAFCTCSEDGRVHDTSESRVRFAYDRASSVCWHRMQQPHRMRETWSVSRSNRTVSEPHRFWYVPFSPFNWSALLARTKF